MSCKCDIYFKEDLGKPGFVPHYIKPIRERDDSIYNLVEDRTYDPELAIEVQSWAELAVVGESFDNDVLHAEIVDD